MVIFSLLFFFFDDQSLYNSKRKHKLKDTYTGKDETFEVEQQREQESKECHVSNFSNT